MQKAQKKRCIFTEEIRKHQNYMTMKHIRDLNLVEESVRPLLEGLPETLVSLNNFMQQNKIYEYALSK